MSADPLPSDTPLDQSRPLGDHLGELRGRIVWCLAAVGMLMIPAWSLGAVLIEHMSRITGPLVFLSPTEIFLVRMKLAGLLGLGLGMPVVLYHLWRFVGVALTVRERRVVLGALPFSYGLFAAGAALGWWGVAPVGLRFLLGFSSERVVPTLSVAACVSFALWTSLGLGVLFQLPVVIGALARWGFVRAARLARLRRQALLAILIVAALLTPGPDVFSQLMLAVPTYALFEVSVVVARFLEP